jgi:large repetitive protein
MRTLLKFLIAATLFIAGSSFAQFCPFPPCEGGGGPTPKFLMANTDTLNVTNPSGGSVNVLSNDTSDFSPITPTLLLPLGDLSLGLTNDAGLTSYLSLNSTTGLLTVSGSPTAGSYTINYQVCQTTYSGNCATGTVNLTVTAAPPATMVATTDQVDIWPNNTTITVLSNDTVNGSTATASTASVVLVSDGGLTGLTVNGAGQFDVPLSRIYSRRFSPTYKICEVGNLTNCSSTVTVNIDSHATLVATPDTSITFTSAGGSFNLLANDTYNGAVATTSTVFAGYSGLPYSAPSQIYIENGLLVATPLPAGAYTYLRYRICEVSTLITNGDCTTDVALNVTVTNSTVVAVADTGSVVAGVGGTVSILTNDTVNGSAVTATTVTPSIVTPVTGFSINGSGQLVVATTVTAGSYPVTYKICEIGNLTNCSSTVTATVTVLAGPIAVADSATVSTAGGTIDILANDTFNGSAANFSLVLTQGGTALPPGVTQNTAGLLVVPAGGTPGAYSGTYRLCERDNPSNCSGYVAVNITIISPPQAVADTASLTTAGGTINILANDLRNGAQATSSNVIATLSSLVTGFSIDSSSRMVVASGTAAGAYSVYYHICDLALPSSCSSYEAAYVTITLPAATMVAVADTGFTMVAGTVGAFNILTNDTSNGAAATTTTVTPSIVTPVTGFSINGSGQLAVATTVAAGSYTVAYKICEVGNLTNCSGNANATVTVTAAAATMVAVADSASIAPIATNVTVLTNDTVNSVAATVSTATVTIVSDGGLTGLSVNGSGQLVVPARAPSSSASPTYKICEVGNLTNCSSTVAVTLTTLAGPVAVADTATVIAGAGGTVNILANDTYNGAQATSSNVTASLSEFTIGRLRRTTSGTTVRDRIASSGSSISINSSSQMVVGVNVIAGIYDIAYKICDNAAPTSCSGSVNATLTITALTGAAGLTAADDGITMPVAGGTLNLFTNDKYNSTTVTASVVTVTLTSNGGASGAVIGSTGDLIMPAGLAQGAYSIGYQICLISAPTVCATAKASIIISAAVTSAVKKAPSVAGATSASSVVITTGQSPISFGTGGPTVAGSINDAIVYSGVRASFGDRIGGLTFLNLRASQNIPSFNATIFYSGSGNLKARWEVIQPGDADPNDFDLVPEDGLTLPQMVQRHTYTLVDRVSGYLAPMGSYSLLGPDPNRLPKTRLGTYRILLRLESTGSGRAGAFYIPFITYRIQSDPIEVEKPAATPATPASGDGTSTPASAPVKSRFTANTNVADFSKIGEIDVGASFHDGGGIKVAGFDKKVPSVGFESIGTKLPKAGQQIAATETLKFEWDEPKTATVDFWSLEMSTEAGELLAVTRVAKKTDYVLSRPMAARLPKDRALRWRVRGVDKEGHVTATSPWLFFTLNN